MDAFESSPFSDDYKKSSEAPRTLHFNEKWLIFFTLLSVLVIIALVFGIMAFVNDTSGLSGNSAAGRSSTETYILKYEPSRGTLAETPVANTYVTRYLNNIRYKNTVSESSVLGVSLENNQFTLRSGTWSISAAAPVYRAGANFIILYNITTGAVEAQGQSSFSNTTGGAGQSDQCIALLEHTWTTTSSSVYEIRHYVNASIGQRFTFGNPVAKSTGANIDVEVYTIVTLTRK